MATKDAKSGWFFSELSEEEIGSERIDDVQCGKHFIRIAQPADAEKLLDLDSVHSAFKKREYMPYWASIWPVSRYLAHHILESQWDSPLKTLELGCGLGLAGIGALKAGHDVTFSDYDLTALKFAKRNAELNGFKGVRTLALDWYQPTDEKFELLVAGDLTYEKPMIRPLINLISRMMADDGRTILADQNRVQRAQFLEELRLFGLKASWQSFDIDPKFGWNISGSIYYIEREN